MMLFINEEGTEEALGEDPRPEKHTRVSHIHEETSPPSGKDVVKAVEDNVEPLEDLLIEPPDDAEGRSGQDDDDDEEVYLPIVSPGGE